MSSNKRMFRARGSGITALVLAGVLYLSSDGRAQTPTFDPVKVQKGLAISPVPLNLQGKDANLVGYGSYLINAVADCNGCHSAGPQNEFATGGNPYQGQHPTVLNPATYLAGGRDFGAFPDPSGPFPHIISRNLTPDSSGLAVGGDTFDQFLQTIRTGLDPDKLHPTCTGPPNGKCIPAPFNGDLLQIMPWPVHLNMTDDDLRAIYTFLSAIPCLVGPGDPANRCVPTAKTVAVAGPKNASTVLRDFQLDGTKSTSSDGKPLTYQWTIPQGSPSAAIFGGSTTTPTVQLRQRGGLYTFQLTVTDSTGKSATDVTMVTYQGN